MNIKLLTEHHLEFLSLKGGCTGSSESTSQSRINLECIHYVGFIAVLEEAFDLCDHDKNGTICSSELGLVLRALGFNPTDKEVKNMVKEIDKNSTYILILLPNRLYTE